MYRKLVLVAVLAALVLPSFSHATGDKQIPRNPIQPPPVVIHETDHDGYLVGALIGAGVTYWLMRRHKKRHAPPAQVRIVPAECPVVQCPTVPTCEVQTERVFAECVAK